MLRIESGGCEDVCVSCCNDFDFNVKKVICISKATQSNNFLVSLEYRGDFK
jgi:hypothetical protein